MNRNILLAFGMMMVFLSVFSSPVFAQSCDIEIYGLVAENDHVYAHIENLGDSTETINYTFYVDDEEVNSGVTDIDSGEEEMVSHSYNFAPGSYDVELRAEADCGATDIQRLIHTRIDDWDCSEPDYCIEGAIRCDCDDEIVYVCDGDEWIVLAEGENEYCEYCGGDDCCGLPDPYWDCELCGCDDYGCTPSGDCGVHIEEMVYTDNLGEDSGGSVEVTVRNTGVYRETVTIRLFVDELLTDSNSVSIGAGDETSRTFTFITTPGTHEIKVSARANCGSLNSMSRIINVVDLGDHVGPPQPPGPEPGPTLIVVDPPSLDIQRYDARPIVVNIKTDVPQYFRVDVRDYNFERSWIDYTYEFWVEDEMNAYIYVTPREYGEYCMDVYVTARTDWTSIRQHVEFFVSAPREQELGWLADVVNFFTHPVTVMVTILSSLFVVIYAGIRFFVPETEAWEA